LHTLQPGEDYDGDTLIPQEYLDEQARLDRLDDQRVKCDYQNHIKESQLRARRAAELASSVSSTSSSTNPPQPTQSSSSVIVSLSQHLHGELPSYQLQPNQRITSETVPDLTVLENQQQHISSPQRAPDLCTTLIVLKHQQQPSSPSQTTSDIQKPRLDDNGVLMFPDRVCVPDILELKTPILEEGHRSSLSLCMLFWFVRNRRLNIRSCRV
jgi:hypothetical protein